MATLYEINAAILDCVDAETGEIIDESRLDALMMERGQKLENVALWIKDLESDAVAIKAEEKALKKRRESIENRTKSLKTWLQASLNGERMETPKVHITFRKSVATEIDELQLPQCWMRMKTTYVPDVVAIKQALKDGMEIPGAKLIERQNIQIQ